MSKVLGNEEISIEWIKCENKIFGYNKVSLKRLFPGNSCLLPKSSQEEKILEQLKKIYSIGEKQLWEGYGQINAKRSPEVVSTSLLHGRFYSLLVKRTRPSVILEFGAAFGVSGVYWLASLEKNKKGHLYTYEVNSDWSAIAANNLSEIGTSYTLTTGLFEKNIEKTLGNLYIDIAFIDGVHTSEWVIPQFDTVSKHMKNNGIIILDDISFSNDMEECWAELYSRDNVINAFRLNHRVGIIQISS